MENVLFYNDEINYQHKYCNLDKKRHSKDYTHSIAKLVKVWCFGKLGCKADIEYEAEYEAEYTRIKKRKKYIAKMKSKNKKRVHKTRTRHN